MADSESELSESGSTSAAEELNHESNKSDEENSDKEETQNGITTDNPDNLKDTALTFADLVSVKKIHDSHVVFWVPSFF